MRLARLLVLAAATLAAAALTAPAASGQNLEVLGEEHAAGQEEVHHCPPVQLSEHIGTGGCRIHATSEMNTILVFHDPDTSAEDIISICSNEFTGRINEDGMGYITNQILAGVNCLITPCDEAESAAHPHRDHPWPAGLFETGADPRSEEEVLITTFCVRPSMAPEGPPGITCTVLIDAIPTRNSHQWEFDALDTPCTEDNGIELTGHWVTEGEGFETVHLDDFQ
jgi:hypothetical protein